MKRITKWATQMSLGAAFVAGAVMFVPTQSHATSVNITQLTVTVGDITACISGCVPNSGAGGAIWGAATGVINSSDVGGIQSLIVTQTAGFNFDTSEGHPQSLINPNCSAANPCAVSIAVNGVTQVNLPASNANALNNFNTDPGGAGHQEAQNFTQIFDGGPGGFRISIGYADTAHNGVCLDNNAGIPGSLSQNCIPDPFASSSTVRFVGAAGGTVELGGCTRVAIAPTGAPCFDAGAVLIQLNAAPVTTPEPASMFLLGGGLLGFAAWRRRRRRS